MNDLNKRNTQAVAAQVIELDKMVRDQQMMIAQLANSVASFDRRLLQVEAQMAAHRINNLGVGPTVKQTGDGDQH